MPTAEACRADSSNGYASLGRSPCSRRCCCSTNPPRRSIRFRRLKVEETLQALREKYCIVVVTHNLQQAARVSNVTGFMYLGELVEIGPSSEIFTAPRNRRTDDYITGRFG